MKTVSVRRTGLVLLLMALLLIGCMSFANAETKVASRLPFDPADTWEEAKALDLEIVRIEEDPQYLWHHIAYKMPDTNEAIVFYLTDSGNFYGPRLMPMLMYRCC